MFLRSRVPLYRFLVLSCAISGVVGSFVNNAHVPHLFTAAFIAALASNDLRVTRQLQHLIREFNNKK